MEPTQTNKDLKDRHIELPAPTAFPMVVAFGLTLLAAGLVTHWLVSLTGFICALFGAVGWFKDIYPHEKHEAVPLLPESDRAVPVAPASHAVDHLVLGKDGHRVRFPVAVHPYTAGIVGGLAGGTVMAVIALSYGFFAHQSPWWPINLLSAAVLPSLDGADVETLKAFSMPGLLIGIVVHGLTSILVGLMYAAVLPMFPKFAWLWAGILTPLFWSLLFYGGIGIIDPTLEQHVDWTWFVICQLSFGMVGGFVVARSEKIETMQTWPLAQRAGVEAMQPDQPEEVKKEKKEKK